MATMGLPRPPSRLTQPGELPFNTWRDEYAYFVDCMMACLRSRLQPSEPLMAWDWEGARRSLERHLYETSTNRYKTFVLLK